MTAFVAEPLESRPFFKTVQTFHFISHDNPVEMHSVQAGLKPWTTPLQAERHVAQGFNPAIAERQRPHPLFRSPLFSGLTPRTTQPQANCNVAQGFNPAKADRQRPHPAFRPLLFSGLKPWTTQPQAERHVAQGFNPAKADRHVAQAFIPAVTGYGACYLRRITANLTTIGGLD